MPVYPAGMANPRKYRFLVALLCLGAMSTAGAWGKLGHALVGDLAERHLDPKAKAEVAVLLAGEAEPGAPTWADRVLTHPALSRVATRMHRATFPQQLTFCGGPVLIQTARMLAKAREDALARRRSA